MKLPNYELATIPRKKIVDYLLSPTHPRGRGKAGFFLLFGFDAENWEALAQVLLSHAATHEVTATADTQFGKRYVVEGEIRTPDGRTPLVRVVWHIDHGSDQPRLATAYPLARPRT